jgi:hypothetical protein
MMRLFDRVASGERVFDLNGTEVSAKQTAALRKSCHENVRVVADEAAQYFWQSKQDIWDPKDGSFGPLRAPFDAMWIEWNTPMSQWTTDGWQQNEPAPFAIFVNTRHESDKHITVLHGVHWQASHRCVMLGPVGGLLVVDDAGVVNEHRLLSNESIVGRQSDFYGLGTSELATQMYQMYFPGLLALGWMNCKNINLVTDRPNERIAKKRQRRGKFAGLSYERLVIDGAAGQPTRSNREAEATGKRLHMVRGHFATYTDERPLFGRVTGTFWRAWHVRGDASFGQIHHEYHLQGQR